METNRLKQRLEDLTMKLFGKTELSLNYKNPQEVADEDYKRIEKCMKNIQWLSGNLTKKGRDFGQENEAYSQNDIYGYNWYGHNHFYQDDGVYQRVRHFLEGYWGSVPRRDCDSKQRDFCKSKLNFKIIRFRNKYLLTTKIFRRSKTYDKLGVFDAAHFGRNWLLTTKHRVKGKLILIGAEK